MMPARIPATIQIKTAKRIMKGERKKLNDVKREGGKGKGKNPLTGSSLSCYLLLFTSFCSFAKFENVNIER